MPIDDALDKIESNGIREELPEEERYSLDAAKTGLEQCVERVGLLSPEEVKQYSKELKYIKEKTEKITEIIKGYDKPVEPVKPVSTPTSSKRTIGYLACFLEVCTVLAILSFAGFILYRDTLEHIKRIEKKAYFVTVDGKQAQIIPVVNGLSHEVGTKVKLYDMRGNLDRVIYDNNSGEIGDSFADYIELFGEREEPRKIVKGGAKDVPGKLEEEMLLNENDVLYKKVMLESLKERFQGEQENKPVGEK